METKTVYQYDKDGYYIQNLILDDTDKSPSGAWNIPANCTEVAPQIQEGYKCKWNGDMWEQEKIPHDVLCYYNDGLSFRTVKSDYVVQTGEVLFGVTPTTEQLQQAFPSCAEKYLASAKAKKLQEIDTWTAEHITGGFVSSCTGTAVKYDSDKDTQITMQGIALNAANIATEHPSGIPVRGYVGDATAKTVQLLTGAQLLQWCADLSLHIGSCKQIGWDLQAAVNDPNATAESIALIVWPA